MAVHDLYVGAGKPGTRKISNAIRARDDLPDTASHEAVRAILGGSRSSWHKVESVVRVLAAWSVAQPDVIATVQRLHQLWLTAHDTAVVPPIVRPADPAVLRQAVRGIHGPTHDDAISTFLETTVFVPRADNGAFLVAATPTEGLWVCVFTEIERLRAHVHATRPTHVAGWTPIVGRELVCQMYGLHLRAGILVDPPAASDQDVSETMPLPVHLVAEIAMMLSSP